MAFTNNIKIFRGKHTHITKYENMKNIVQELAFEEKMTARSFVSYPSLASFSKRIELPTGICREKREMKIASLTD